MNTVISDHYVVTLASYIQCFMLFTIKMNYLDNTVYSQFHVHTLIVW